ncbi:MAG TPA: Clp protease N-terminal domain-containing protein [Planctomycetaceae bacterium]|jgi:ATP-dependent Clp protease ATP-binding subunit ClpC
MLWTDLQDVKSIVRSAGPDFEEFNLTDCAVDILLAASKRAMDRGPGEITPEHVLFGMATPVERRMVRVVLKGLGVDLPRNMAQISAILPARAKGDTVARHSFSPQTVRLLSEAKAESDELGHNWIGSEHLLLGLLRCGPCAAGEFLRETGVTPERFRRELVTVLTRSRLSSSQD